MTKLALANALYSAYKEDKWNVTLLMEYRVCPLLWRGQVSDRKGLFRVAYMADFLSHSRPILRHGVFIVGRCELAEIV